MWKQKIGISILNHYLIPTVDVVKLLKKIGFDAISPIWEVDSNLSEIVDAAKECELDIQSLHAPFIGVADMWNRHMNTPYKENLLKALNDCVKFQIPILVMHPWIGFEYDFDAQALYFEHFDDIVAYAAEHHIKIAFENTEGEEYLFALMEHYENNDTVGFCWDSGHEMCYNHSQDLLAKYGDRLVVTHLNDNLGISRFDGTTNWTDDLHLLPYDGIADWNYNIERLKKSRPMDILNFELNIQSKPDRHDNDIYEQMSLAQYFTEAYKRACKIAYQYSK